MIKTTHLLGGAAVLFLSASATLAFPATSWERAELFATCSGRLAAIATHQHGLGASEHNENSALRETFETLLEATLPDAYDDGVPEQKPREWRALGWSDIATLIADSQYSLDQARVDHAESRIAADLKTCRQLVLGAS